MTTIVDPTLPEASTAPFATKWRGTVNSQSMTFRPWRSRFFFFSVLFLFFFSSAFLVCLPLPRTSEQHRTSSKIRRGRQATTLKPHPLPLPSRAELAHSRQLRPHRGEKSRANRISLEGSEVGNGGCRRPGIARTPPHGAQSLPFFCLSAGRFDNAHYPDRHGTFGKEITLIIDR